MPSRPTFAPHEHQLIRRLNTPQKVQRHLNAMRYNNEETMRTFRGVVQHQASHCLEAALFAAVTLEQHGYAPHLLDIGSQDGLGHVLWVYRKNGHWGSIGRSRDPGLHGRKPQFRTIKQLVASYALPFVDFSGRITEFGTFDLRSLRRYDWRLSSRNVWHVERTLIEMPHNRFRMADSVYQRWYRRYCDFKAKHPHRKPIYYPNRSSWSAGYPKR